MTSLSERIAALSPEKRELLLRQLKTRASQEQDVAQTERGQAPDRDKPSPPLQAYDRPGPINHFPLSFAQERLWFLNQWNPSSAWYNLPMAFRLAGMLNVEVLERSLATVIQRHEILRTTIEKRSDGPVQVIAPVLPIQVPVIDLEGLAITERDQQVRQLARAEAQRSFDLATGPLLRIYLLRLDVAFGQGQAPQEHVLLFTLHHIISDAWSTAVLVREVGTLYQVQINGELAGQAQGSVPTTHVRVGQAQGTVPALPELPIQYADYTLWQRQWLQGGGSGQASNQEDQLAYWRQQLSGTPALLDLPTDYPRKASRTNAGAKLSLLLLPALLQELKSLSQREGVTLFMTGLAAFQVLLMRYSGQQDIVVGTSIANRRHAGLENLIGFFANTLVLRSDLSGNPSFEQLLARVRAVAIQAYAHQDLPFEKLVAELAPDQRSVSHSPLFQVFFALLNIPSALPLDSSGFGGYTSPLGRRRGSTSFLDPFEGTATDITLTDLTFHQMKTEHFTSLFDLSLVLVQEERGLLTEVEYSTDLFDETTITRLLSHWQILLEAIVRDPGQPIETLPLLTEAEREHLLVQWNDTGRIASAIGCPDLCAHQLFEQQVERTPDSVALAFGEDEVFTYRELNRLVNQLAHHLQHLGVAPEVLVGICLERSIEMVVGLLAVLKAGGAYVPLDPTHPTERLAFLLQNTHVEIVLTQKRLCSQIPASAAHLLVWEHVWETVTSQADQNLMSMASLANLAYIIYTSGSTGVPKGVQVTHRGLGNLGLAQAEMFAIKPGSWVLQFASLSFDASVSEILMALLAGGSLYLTQAARIQPGADLLKVLQERAITCMTLPPSVLAVLPISVSLPALQTLVVAGEACPVELMAHWAEGRHFFNAYGPTEATVCASIAQCEVGQSALSLLQYPVTDRRSEDIPTQPPAAPNADNSNRITPNMSSHRTYPNGLSLVSVPSSGSRKDIDSHRLPGGKVYTSNPNESSGNALGRPLMGIQLYVLDRHLQPVSYGVIGEIYLGGIGLARGYLHQPDLTAERFIPDPFVGISAPTSSQPGARLYRTGDLARCLANGTIEYIGRIDQQVKLRGFRIELGEIEAVLSQHPSVRECVVVLRDEGQHIALAARKSLVAYVVAQDEEPAMELAHRRQQLQDHLCAQLPGYMIPASMLFLESMPLTPNGKIDRKALLAIADHVGLQHQSKPAVIPLTEDSPSTTQSTEGLVGARLVPVPSAPTTPLQELLMLIWQEVLHRPQVDIHDNFFEIGGHSLLATQVAMRMSQALEIDLSLTSLFEAPTIADLTSHLEELLRGSPSPVVHDLAPMERPDDLPLSFAQERLWFLNQWNQSSAWYNIPMALCLSGQLHVRALEHSLTTIIQRHEVLRTTFEERSGRPVQVITPQRLIQTPVASNPLVPVIDLCGLVVTERDRQVAQLARAEASQPFDLMKGPLLRVGLLRLGGGCENAGQEHVLLFTLHHIISDAWSMGVLMRELTRLYQAEVSGKPAQLPELPIQYADYALWQRQCLQGEVLNAQMTYWRGQLSGVPALLELPTDRPRPAVQRHEGAQQSLLISPELLQQLKSLSQRGDVTLFMTLLATFQVLLMRYCGQSDIVVGTPIVNRWLAGGGRTLESLIGLFANTLVLRNDLSGNPSFLQLLARVREVTLQAYVHQGIPLEKLVEELQPERSMSHQPLFQVLFSLQIDEESPQTSLGQTHPMGQAHRLLPELSFRSMQVESQTTKFDLSLMLSEGQAGLQTVVEYNTDLFDAATMMRLLRHWQMLLEAIVHDPGQAIETLPLLTPDEREQLLVEWNATSGFQPTGAQSTYPQDLCVHQLFEQQVVQTPDAIAIIFEEAALTYSELNAQANRLAHHLIRRDSALCLSGVAPESCVGVHHLIRRDSALCLSGEAPESCVGVHHLIRRDSALCLSGVAPESFVGVHHLIRRDSALCLSGVAPESFVGVCMERSLELVVALLAILKAGGAYVPLDPRLPPERFSFMLEDAQVSVVLTQAHLRDSMRQAHRLLSTVRLIYVEPNTTSQDQDNPPCWVQPDNLAYLMYTSGSTGQPKGVQIPHHAVSNFLASMQREPGLQAWDTLLAVTAVSFDIAGLELFLPLVTGARVVIVSREVAMDGAQLVQVLREHGTTIMQATPSTWRILLDADWQNRDKTSVLCGGEAFPPDLARQLLDLGGTVWNLYGPTETTIWSTLYLVEATTGPCSGDTPIPTGRPIANTQIYLLDRHLQPVPIGVPGELYIGGEGLARGYYRQPELTAERFIPNPFVGTGLAPVRGGERLYRTGDLARYRADGNIEYLGRIDSQVKIRGFRIELGEIEAVLSKLPGVKAAVVLAREDTPGDKRLVAYIVAEVAQNLNTGERRQLSLHWRESLREKLPDYMIPAIFVILEELPKTPNGKLDRRSLPTPERSRSDRDATMVLARTATEEVLAVIWASVLGREQVGIHDNFFALGGDSMRSIQVLSQARERGLHFSLQDLFRHQTIYALAQVLGAAACQKLLLAEPVQAFSLIAPQDRLGLSADVEDAYPLTMMQAGLVFHSLYNPASAVYHDIFSYHLEVPIGQADRLHQLLQTALEQLAANHPILRTSFDLTTFSESLQLVHRNVTIPLQVQDLRTLSPTEQDERIGTWIEEEKSHPFVWIQAPLLRIQIHWRSERSFQLTLSCHHAILDGWSVASLLTELVKIYLRRCESAATAGDDASFTSAPTIQFRDFVALERKLIASQEARQYWLEKLHGAVSAKLPRWTKVRQPADNTSVYVLPVPISDELSASLKRVAQEITVPIKSVLLAAHLRVLSLLHGQVDVLTGLVSNGRPEVAGGERTLGLFLNTLPFRIKLSGWTWIELIRAIFAAECELLPYRWYPLIEIQKQVGVQTLFETIFNFVHFHVFQDVLEVGDGTSSSPVHVLGRDGFESTNFALSATFYQDAISSQIHLSLQCDLQKLCVEQIEAIGGYYAQTLAELVREPDGPYAWPTPLFTQERGLAHLGTEKELAFSLFYFANDAAEETAMNGYKLLLEGAKFADQQGFQALWTPERHFHEFGGLYPNPSVTSAALAMITQRLQIRAGSVVLPLHNPIRVAEEWALVDNLSQGRVGIAFASGWHANDFVFAPDKYAQRREILRQNVEIVRKLWRGETITVQGGAGHTLEVRTLPRPVQKELPVWITSGGSLETFRLAGEIGAHVLTHLLGQDVKQLATKIAAYREAWHQHGHDAQGRTGHVTLMIHTFIGTDLTTVRETVRQPFRNYLRSSVDLLQPLARSMGLGMLDGTFDEDDMQALLDHAFERYFETSGLMGTIDSCLPMIERLKTIGVDEIACLIDFGIAVDDVLAGLHHLVALKERCHPATCGASPQTEVSPIELSEKILTRDPAPAASPQRPAEHTIMVAPRTYIEKRLAAIWTELLEVEQISISDNFFDLGGHSLLAVKLLNRMNKEFSPWLKARGQKALSLTTLFQVPTIEQTAALLQASVRPEESRAPALQGTGSAQGKIPTAGTSSCVLIQPVRPAHGQKDLSPFFCVHPSPGVVSCFLDLAKHLRHDRAFYGIQESGLDIDEALFNSIEEMAAFYIDELLAVQLDGPYFLGGHSFGGYVAFEMAQQLQARGCSVALLALLDCYPREQDASAPTSLSLDVSPASMEMVKDYVRPIKLLVETLGHYWSTKIAVSYDDLSRLQPNEQLVYLLDRLREAQVVPDDTDISQVRRLVQVSETNLYILQKYRPQPYPGKITLFRSEDTEADPLSWAPFSAAPVEVHSISGDHILMLVEPYVQSLAAQLQQCLDKADNL